MTRNMLKWTRYSVVFIGFAVGTEIIYKCIKYLYDRFKTKSANQNVYWKVIFFPDKGILSENLEKHSLLNVLETSEAKKENDLSSVNLSPGKRVHHNSVIADDFHTPAVSPTNYSSLASNTETSYSHQANRSSVLGNITTYLKPSPPELSVHVGQRSVSHADEGKLEMSSTLQQSTSLIHMVEVIESSRRSLAVCVYLLSCSDLIEAIIRAKVRGVRVRVVLDKGMSPMSNVSPLLQNGIPIRYSRPPQMMHNKFAIIDAPEKALSNSPAQKENASDKNVHRISNQLIYNSNSCIQKSNLWFHNERVGDNNYNGILMTGSFNWTWSGVVCNHENVIITNNHSLVVAYAEEFEKLWNSFEFTPAESC